MNAPAKFLFDECVGAPVMDMIRQAISLLSDETELEHVLDFQKQGEWDEKWIPRIAEDGSWVVVTADRGKRGGKKKGEKLPAVCKRYGVTHVQLSAAIHARTSFQKLAAILSVWQDLKKLANAPKGSRHVLRLKGKKPGTPTLVQIDPPPADESQESEKPPSN